MTPEETTKDASNQIAILTELSAIKSSLAVNTSETGNIKTSIAEIKTDIKEIKNDYPSRRELIDAIQSVRDEIPSISDHEDRIRNLESKVWKAIGALAVLQIIVLPVIFYLLFRALNQGKV